MLDLEAKIMQEIGLGNHYHWFNGSRSCGGIRRAAAAKLEQVIRDHHTAGDPIAAPNRELVQLIVRVARHEGEDERGYDGRESVLTQTWQAAATAIRAHMDYAAGQRDAMRDARDYIRGRFLPARNPTGRIIRTKDGRQIVNFVDFDVTGHPLTPAALTKRKAQLIDDLLG